VQLDAAPLFAGAEVLRCMTERRGKWSNYFHQPDLAAISSHGLDFMLRFGFNIVRGPVLKAARYGVWSCHFMDEQKYRGQPPCYWECYFDDSSAAGMLQRLTHRLDGGVKLKQVQVDLTRGSIRDNIDDLFGALAPTAAAVCRDILAGQAAYLDAPPVATSAPIYTTPNNAQMLRIMRHERRRLAALRREGGAR
jgi:methionyl-tRNA formyltransferase